MSTVLDYTLGGYNDFLVINKVFVCVIVFSMTKMFNSLSVKGLWKKLRS